ncbi:MAG: bifunctional methionine sulfoxide reductase B/A protein [Fimbriimonadaceae bacterium]|nr:bifunctional methionine sulfoxide reductase B/A protein [Fimbriimonadaceae bacterium]
MRRSQLVVALLVGCGLWLAVGRTGEAPPEAPKEQTMAEQTGARPGPMPPLSAEEAQIIRHKGTERPFSGAYTETVTPGVYVCRQCGAPLYESSAKFRSECGWPSFDDELPLAVRRQVDADGSRTEILCASCAGHLGHVFQGEGFTAKNVRHCVNSRSLVLRASSAPVQWAIFAGGCFWGVEEQFAGQPGVLVAQSGYTGGRTVAPTYEQICTGTTGHAEAVRVAFDPGVTSFEKLARLFFEIHDPTTLNRQGPDAGTQYRSAVFYFGDGQRQTAAALIEQLRAGGWAVVTALAPAGPFYAAEAYHQNYLARNPGRVSCHRRVPRFEQRP